VDHDVVESLDVDAGRTPSGATGARHARDRGRHLFGLAAAAQFAVQALDHGERRDLTLSIAMKSASMSSKFIPVMTASSALDESDVAIGRPSRRSALVSSSRPPQSRPHDVLAGTTGGSSIWRVTIGRSRASRVTDRRSRSCWSRSRPRRPSAGPYRGARGDR